MSLESRRKLIVGIGNPGRQDDGLGWAFLDSLGDSGSGEFALEYRYQLQIEDAELISRFETVVFVDADRFTHPDGFEFSRIGSTRAVYSFSSHVLAPETVIELARTLYRRSPDCFILSISGSSFDLEIGLTESGRINLDNVLVFFRSEMSRVSEIAHSLD